MRCITSRELQVLTGDIPGDVLVTLSAEEMASSDMRAKNNAVCVVCTFASVRACVGWVGGGNVKTWV
jgi:hypothetical protein